MNIKNQNINYDKIAKINLNGLLNDFENYNFDKLPSSDFIKALEDISSFIDKIDNDLVATNENLVTKLIISIFDTLIPMNMVTDLSNWLRRKIKDLFKEIPSYSELEVFTQSNKIAIYKIFKLPYTSVFRIKIYYSPLYLQPLKSIEYFENYNNIFDIQTNNVLFLTSIKQIISYIKVGAYEDVNPIINKIYNVTKNDEKLVKDISSKLNPIIKQINLSILFNKMDEIKLNYDSILKYKKIYDMPTSTLMNLENINKVVNEFIDDFNKNKITIDNKKSSIKAIKDLSKSLYNIGLFYEAYALNIKIYAQLENHIIQILSVLKNKI